jgi:ABC-type multidrug transport system fused ATPase/permease subunit
MSKDADVKREAPATIRGYLKEMAETFRLAKWVWNERQTSESPKYFKRYLFFVVLTMIMASLSPYAMSFIFDGIRTKDLDLVVKGFVGFGICYAGSVITMRLHFRAREMLVGEHMMQWDNRITERMFEKSVGQHIQHASELGVSNIDKGRWRAHELENLAMFEGVTVLFSMALSYIFLWILSPVAGAIATLMIAVHAGWSLFLNHRTLQGQTPLEKEFRRINRWRVEVWEKIERVKVNAKENSELNLLQKDFWALLKIDRKFWMWYISQISARAFVNNVFTVLIMIYGAWCVWRGDWSMGLLFPLFAWTQKLTDNMWRISEIEHRFNFNMPSVKSLRDALEIEPEIVDDEDAVDLNGAKDFTVELCGLTHTYPGQKNADGEDDENLALKKDPRPVLKDISFAIQPGEKVALLGLSGSGKTTIMRMLLRYMDPQQGSVKINGNDLRSLKLSSWLKHVGYIAQQPQILDNTLRHNLLYALSDEERSKMNDEQIWEHMRRYCIDFEDRLTHGLETRVGKNGVQLSGGEAQRLMIGAAMIKNPRFLVIDEATSSLDSLTEHQVQQGLEKALEGDVSALVIAHRLSTVRRICDKFIVMQPANKLVNGDAQIEAVASSFEELYELSPTFRALADRQELRI